MLAHPERCARLSEKPSLVDEIAATGAFVQVNWDSLGPMNWCREEEVAIAFARGRSLHCLATDSHGPVHRSPVMVQHIAEAAETILTRKNLRLLMIENPERVLRGEDLQALEIGDVAVPVQGRRRKRSLFK